MMNYPAASNGVSIGILLSLQGAGNSPLVRLRRIKNAVVLLGFHAAVTPSFQFRLLMALPKTLLFQDWEIIEFWKHSLAMAVLGNPKPILTPSPELLIRNYTKFDAIFVKFHKRLQSAEFILVLVPRPLKNSDFEDEHEDEKNQIKARAYAPRPQPYTMQIV